MIGIVEVAPVAANAAGSPPVVARTVTGRCTSSAANSGSRGVTLLTNLLEPKRFSVLRDLMPGVSLIGVLHNPKFPAAEPALRRRPIQTRALDLWRDDDTVEVIGSPIELKRGAYVKSKVRCRLLQDFGGRNGYPRAIDLHLVVGLPKVGRQSVRLQHGLFVSGRSSVW